MSGPDNIFNFDRRFSGNSHQRRVQRRRQQRIAKEVERRHKIRQRCSDAMREGDARILQSAINDHLLREFGVDAPTFRIET